MTDKEAIHKVFDQYLGSAMNLPFLVASTLRILDVHVLDYAKRAKDVEKELRAMAKRKEVIILQGAGVSRACDMPEEKRKAALKLVARQKRQRVKAKAGRAFNKALGY